MEINEGIIDDQQKRGPEDRTEDKKDNDLIMGICRFAFDNRYEEAVLVDLARGTVRCVLQNEGSLENSIFRTDELNYIDSLDDISKNMMMDEDAKEQLSMLYPDKLRKVLDEEHKLSIRSNFMTDNGWTAWKQIDGVYLDDERTKVILLITDIQEEEEINEQLREAAESAQQANKAKSAFLANMSHEIRTPMNAIVGVSEILLGKDLPEDVRMDIATIQNSGSSLLGIINDILDFSKIETGKFEINVVEYMLPSLLMDISNVISVRLFGKPVYFMMDIDPELPNHLIGDDIRIKQILINLIGNAVKFTQEGFIELRVSGRFTDKYEYEMTFAVEDSGIGIRKEDFNMLFDTFSQVDTKKNRAITGSGLGLSISRNLAVMMGGDLTVESVYGKGSIFTATIKQRVHSYEPLGEVEDKSPRILICEQNVNIIRCLKSTLRKLKLSFDVCREPSRLRSYEGFTHVLVRRKVFKGLKEKLNFMFDPGNIYLILDNDEHAESKYMNYKQLQLPPICLQLINALNGQEIVTGIRRKSFDRSQIIPLSFARVLVVDDNNTNLQVAKGLMAPYKMKVDLANSGFKAIDLIRKNRYDAIFMDHMMPEMDGVETTKHVRELDIDYCKTVPIIALTANAMSGAREMFLDTGMDDFVAKPIEMRELNRVLKKFVLPKAPEGYLEELAAERKAEDMKKSKEAKGSSQAAGSGAVPKEESAGAVKIMAAADSTVIRQLLKQNNLLLSQNMLLLQNMIDEASTGKIFLSPAENQEYQEQGQEQKAVKDAGLVKGSGSMQAQAGISRPGSMQAQAGSSRADSDQGPDAAAGSKGQFAKSADEETEEKAGRIVSPGNQPLNEAKMAGRAEDTEKDTAKGSDSPSAGEDELSEEYYDEPEGLSDALLRNMADMSDPDEKEEEEDEELYGTVDGIDMEGSVEIYGGSVRIYHNILKTYYYDICQREPELEELYSKKDIQNFTIYVHAIKSASRGAGAADLGEMAYGLEMAGKQQDWDKIEKDYPAFKAALREMIENLGEYVEEYLLASGNESERPGREAFPEDTIKELKSACRDMDYMRAEELLNDLDQYSYPEDAEKLLHELLAFCAGFEYDKLEEKVEAL